MDQDTAKRLFEEGAFLILLDVPEKTEFGMDWNSWLTGPLFKGVKMIPPGLHFVFYSSNNKYGGSNSPRTGFFHWFKLKEILVGKWNRVEEEIQFVNCSDDEMAAIKSNLKDMDRNLAPYPYDKLKKWVSLTDRITPGLADRLNPDSGNILSAPELVPFAEERVQESSKADQTVAASQRRQMSLDEAGLPMLKCKPGTEIKFSKVPKRWYPDGASAREMSQHSMDSSYILDCVIKNHSKPDDILGELQFSFICFVLGQVLDAFEQWKELVHMLCSCDKSLPKFCLMYENLLTVFYHQLNEIPKDFFVDIVSSNNFLVSALSTLFSNMESGDLDPTIKNRAKQFRKYLTKKFKWDFSSEPEDWAPVVVET